MKPWRLAIAWIAAAVLPGFAQPTEVQRGYVPLRAAIHVHSTFSNGAHNIFELAAMAHQRQLDVLGITDSFLTRARYGIPPLRRLLSRTASRPGVLDHGIDRYLAGFAEAQQAFDQVLLVPGVEVTPYYYWQGRWPGELTLHDFDRHLLVFGLDPAAIADLPVIENATWSNTDRDWLVLLTPVFLFAAGVALILKPPAWKGRKAALPGLAIAVAGAAALYDAYPFAALPDPYSGRPDYAAFQRLIDYVDARGGLTFWSYPEARYPDIQVSGARMISRGDPLTLVRTQRYTGFEGLYGDTITITHPGNLWDQLLLDYIQGGRPAWPSVLTGIDFHQVRPNNGWYELDRGITVLFAAAHTTDAVLEALRSGRGYASFQRDPERPLALFDYALHSAEAAAISGESIECGAEVRLTATIDHTTAAAAEPAPHAAVTIVRDGRLLATVEDELPIRIDRSDALEPGPHYYRLHVRMQGTEILSNPVFCNGG